MPKIITRDRSKIHMARVSHNPTTGNNWGQIQTPELTMEKAGTATITHKLLHLQKGLGRGERGR